MNVISGVRKRERDMYLDMGGMRRSIKVEILSVSTRKNVSF